METCVKCGRELTEGTYYACKRNICKECVKARNREWDKANVERVRANKTAYNHKVRGKPKRARALKAEPLRIERPLPPTLEVGRQYTIVDIGRTWQGAPGGDDNAKPITYSGPCIARWGRNWGIQTNTGIRTFTSAQLIGLQIKEDVAHASNG